MNHENILIITGTDDNIRRAPISDVPHDIRDGVIKAIEKITQVHSITEEPEIVEVDGASISLKIIQDPGARALEATINPKGI